MQDELIIFCRNIRCLREMYGLSKRAAARALHISVKTLNSLESEIFPPRLTTQVIVNAARTFHVRPADLFAEITQ